MKKLILILTVVLLATVCAHAQDKQKTAAVIDNDAVKQTAQQASATPHYYYKNQRLVKCSCTQWADQPENVKLANGTIVTTKGEVATHHWTKVTKLKDGECVDANGNITDHKQADADLQAKK